MGLVLARRRDEAVVIGGPDRPQGKVTVVDVKGDRVRLRFDFPATVPVNREEAVRAAMDNTGNSTENRDG